MDFTKNHESSAQRIDITTLLLYFALVFVGLLSINSVSYDMGETSGFFAGGRITSQLIWLAISLSIGFLILLIDRHFIIRSSVLLYVSMVVLLIATIFLAPNIKGSHSWLVITNSIRIQPAEFSKVTTTMMLSWWISRYEFNIKKTSDLLVSFLIFLVPLVIIVLQSETGSALVYLSFILVLYRHGLSATVPLLGIFLVILFILTIRYSGVYWGATAADDLIAFLLIYLSLLISTEVGYDQHRRPASRIPGLVIIPATFLIYWIISLFKEVNYSRAALISLGLFMLVLASLSVIRRKKNYLFIALAGILGIIFFYGVEYFFQEVLQPHQQVRILVSLGMEDDPSGAGYNVRQSLIAIGSGGLTGNGYMKGTQTKLSYVPEQETDFIFCTLAEDFGFLGSLVLLALYLTLFLRLIHVAERQTDIYAQVYGYSVACILFFHLVVNIGMVIGLVPVIGIPLPFLSYGGSSLLSFTILIAVLLRLDATNPAP
ncbi:MAG: rod shape-determining protein RodA [Porphyromonas sp.]|nr:rod shape-determining protein RodA [Porphyromonas sp.]